MSSIGGTVIDFAWGRPRPDKIKAAGHVGVLRYLGLDPTKRCERAEAETYLGVGLSLGLIYEDGAEDALGGADIGAQKGAIAKEQLAALGAPGDVPVYFAVDFEIAGPREFAKGFNCIRAFAQTIGRTPAAYGPRPFLNFCEQNASDVEWFLMESAASSWNGTGARAFWTRLAQSPVQSLVDKIAVDVDDVLSDAWGGFRALEDVATPAPTEAAPAA